MPRSRQQIQDDMKADVIAIDPSIDVDKGPVYNIMVKPVSEELYKTEVTVDELSQLLSFNFEEITTDQLEDLAKNFGVFRKPASPSRGSVIFYSYSAPTSDIAIPAGTVVGTSDGEVLFQTTKLMYLRSNTAFYNPASKRYEINVPIESINSNVDASVPPYRVNTLTVQIDGIDGVNNTKSIEGGYDQETDEELADRLQIALLGSTAESGGWIIRQIADYEDVFTSILVPSNDTDWDFRPITKPTLDVFIDGNSSIEEVMVYNAVGGETTLGLDLVPVLEVSEVLLNGEPITGWALVRTGVTGSVDEIANVDLGITLIAADVVEIHYTYNGLVVIIQNEIKNGIFGTDIFTRNMLDFPLGMEITLSVMSSFDSNVVVENVYVYAQEWIVTNSTSDVYGSIDLQEYLKSNVSGISSIRAIVYSTDPDDDQYYNVFLKKGYKASIDSDDILVTLF